MDRPKDCVADTALKAIENGDTPAIGIIMVDGEIITTRARNTFQPTVLAKINGREVSSPGLHEYFFGS